MVTSARLHGRIRIKGHKLLCGSYSALGSCFARLAQEMIRFTLLVAVLTAACHAQTTDTDTMPETRPRSCRELQQMDRFSFLECDDDNPDRFEEEQCVTDLMCYCVDPVTGDRLSDRAYNRREIDCESPDDDDDDDDDDDVRCPDLSDVIRRCGGANCVRKPSMNETCLQCIRDCIARDDFHSCDENDDCEDNEVCIAVGDFARRQCVMARSIPDGGQCVPEYDDDDDDDDDGDNVDDDEDDDDYDDEEETDYREFISAFDSNTELMEGRRCDDDQVCRRVDVNRATCQNRTGPCFENNRRPVGSDDAGPELDCDDDSGEYEPKQRNDRQQWCVHPQNGTEIRNTRRSRSDRLNCIERVFQNCRLSINGRRFTVEHGEEDITLENNICRLCRCTNGRFTLCQTVRCPYIPDSGTQSCTIRGRVVRHRETIQVDCNYCRCVNGDVQCTRRDCSDDEEDDDDDMDDDNAFERCRRMPRSPVCARDLRTYPNKCAALAAGFERLELTPGACSRDVICERFPCMDGFRCVPLSQTCSVRSNCAASDFRRCINRTALRCSTTSDARMEQVCGRNNVTYPSLCHLLQRSDTDIRFTGSCSRTDCPVGVVCGTDGVTYRSICDLRLAPDVRLDYRGSCMNPMEDRNETIRDFCRRIRSTTRCAMRQRCRTTVIPTDGCCPVCGGGVDIDVDEDGLQRYSEEFDDARSTSEIRKRVTDSDLVRDTSGKCSVEAQFASNGNIELLYEAVMDKDASACAERAMMTASDINNLGRASTGRRRRQTEDDGADPVFNFMNVATTLETTNTTTGGGGGGAGVMIASYSVLFASVLLALYMY